MMPPLRKLGQTNSQPPLTLGGVTITVNGHVCAREVRFGEMGAAVADLGNIVIS
jgi:hypothetical protein